jgi:hypothetical protein
MVAKPRMLQWVECDLNREDKNAMPTEHFVWGNGLDSSHLEDGETEGRITLQ